MSSLSTHGIGRVTPHRLKVPVCRLRGGLRNTSLQVGDANTHGSSYAREKGKTVTKQTYGDGWLTHARHSGDVGTEELGVRIGL